MHGPLRGADSAAMTWSDAVEITVRGSDGVQVDPRLKRLGPAETAIKIDATTAGDVTFGTASADLKEGAYSVTACQGSTGGWKGKVCSEPAQLTIAARGSEPTPEQGARFAFLAGDAAGLETFGKRLIAADRESVLGMVCLAEASYRKGAWKEALQRFREARAAYARKSSKGAELPLFINSRISEILNKI